MTPLEAAKDVEELIDVMHRQANELEKLVESVGQATGHLRYQSQFPVVISELSELRTRVRRLAFAEGV